MYNPLPELGTLKVKQPTLCTRDVGYFWAPRPVKGLHFKIGDYNGVLYRKEGAPWLKIGCQDYHLDRWPEVLADQIMGAEVDVPIYHDPGECDICDDRRRMLPIRERMLVKAYTLLAFARKYWRELLNGTATVGAE